MSRSVTTAPFTGTAVRSPAPTAIDAQSTPGVAPQISPDTAPRPPIPLSSEKVVITQRPPTDPNAGSPTGPSVVGPIPLPTKKKSGFDVLHPPHVDKTSREQLDIRTHQRLLDIIDPTQQSVDTLMKLDLSTGPSTVEIDRTTGPTSGSPTGPTSGSPTGVSAGGSPTDPSSGSPSDAPAEGSPTGPRAGSPSGAPTGDPLAETASAAAAAGVGQGAGQAVSALTGGATTPAGAAVAQTAGAAATEAAGAATSTLTSGGAQTATGGALSDAAGAATSALTEHAATPAGGALADTTGAAPSLSTADAAATPAGGPLTEGAGTLSSAPADQSATAPPGEALAEDTATATSAPTEGETKPDSEALASDSSDTTPARAADDASQAPADDAGQADAAAQTPGDTTARAPEDATASATSSPENAGATQSAQEAVDTGAQSGVANIAAAQAPVTSPPGAPALSAQGQDALGAALTAALEVPAAAAGALKPPGVAAAVTVVAATAAVAATSAVAAIAKQATKAPSPSTQAPAETSRPGEQSPAKGTASVYSLGSDATVEQSAENLASKEGHRRVSFGELSALGAQDKLTIVAHGALDRFGGLTPGGLAAHLKDAGVSALGTLSLKGCDSADFARDLQLELQKQGVPVDRITGRNDLVTITTDGRTLVHDGNQWLHQAPGAKTEVRPTGDGGVLASDPYAANDPAAVDARSQPLRESINTGALSESFSYSAADIKTFSKSTPEPARIEKDLKSLMKALETQGSLSVVDPKTRARMLDPGYYSFLQQTYAGDPALLNAALDFIGSRLARHGNVADASSPLDPGTKSDRYRDWFHQFGNTVSLLSTSNLPKPAMTKLLRFSLMQYQLNATYSTKDNVFLSRQTSPIALPGYGRGMRTGLWEAAAQVLNGQLMEQLPPKSKLDSKFYVLPVSAPLTSFGPYHTAGEVTLDINSKANVYIPSLGLQLIKTDKVITKQKIDSELGARGLRKSPGEAAAIVAEAMAGMIQDGKVEDAVGLIRKTVDKIKDAKDLKLPLKGLELRPNTLLVSTEAGQGIDPLSDSPAELLGRVENLYAGLEPKPTDPFYVQQNLEVVRGLLGPDITSLFNAKTPAIISAELADTLTDVHDLIERAREGMDDASTSQIPADNLLIEKLYQTMQRVHDLARFQIDWKGEPGPTLEEAVRGLLPKAAPEPQAVLSRPHALAMINDIAAALGDDAQSVAILKGAYYETPHLFPAEQHVDSVTDAALKDKKVILLEPHPNNAAETEIHPHDVPALFNNLFGTETGPHTVVLDLTLSHLSEPEVATILDAAKPHIQSGKLNLVLVQSGTKFYQSGMDIVNLGTAITFNNGGDTWKGFNDATKNTRNPLPAEDQAYVARMLDRNGQQLMDYLNKIRSNTAELRDLLTDALGQDSAFTLSESTDPTTVYVAFRPTDAFIAQRLGKSVNDLSFDDRMKVNQDVYAKHVLPALQAATLPAVDRTSFGFNVTNFGECATTVRITPGIEGRSFFEAYSKIVADVGKTLAAELPPSLRAASSGVNAASETTTGTPRSADALADPGVETGNTAEPSEPGGQPLDPGVGAVYSLGSDATVEQNAANLAGKDGHRRVSLAELGALGAQDKLTMVAHGDADRFGRLTPGELAAHLKSAGVSALGTLSLKGCDSASFARDLMTELQKQGISVNKITGRNGQVKITKDGQTLVHDGQRWLNKSPGTKSAVHRDETGDVSAQDPYKRHDPAAAEARSAPLREAMNADSLADEAAKQEGAASEIDQILDEIEAMDGSAHFPQLDTAAIAAQLRERLDHPYRVDQGNTGLCGAAAFTSTLAETRPEAYVKLARDLLKDGKGKVGALEVKPGDFVRGFNPRDASVKDADWLMLASIRNDTSAARMSEESGKYGGAKTYEVYDWLKQAGYRQVHYIPADKRFSPNQGDRGLFSLLRDQYNAADARVASRWHPSPPSFLEGKTSAELADPRRNVALAKSFLAHDWSIIGQISEKYAGSTGGGIEQRLEPYAEMLTQAQLDEMREKLIKEMVGSGTNHWAVVKQVEMNAGNNSSLEARIQRYSWGEERWTAALSIQNHFEAMYGGFIAISDAPGANLESWGPAPSTRADPASTGWAEGVGAVYSLGLDQAVEQNAANLAGKPGHRRIWLGELSALGAQDKLTIVAHGLDRGGFAPGDLAGPQDDALFGGLTPGELAAYLKDAGVSALETLSLKGCNSADFARDLMGELRAQGISVNKITGRNDLVTITKDGQTLVRDGQQWSHQAPAAKVEIRRDGSGEVVETDPYKDHGAARVEASSRPLRQAINADPLSDGSGDPEGTPDAGQPLAVDTPAGEPDDRDTALEQFQATLTPAALSYSAADIKTFSRSKADPARIEKELKGLLKALETRGLLRVINSRTRARALDPGYHNFLKQTYAGDAAVLDAALQFIGSRLARHDNVAETARAFEQGTKSGTYRDWFHQFGHTVSLLATRDLPKPAMTKLLRFSLMQHQLNATYSAKDNAFLSRQTSPIALPGYGRGMRTGLWEAAAQVLAGQLTEQLPAKFKLDRKFYLLPVSAPLTNFGPYTTAGEVTPDINSQSNVYIPSLGVQLIKIEGDVTKKKIDGELGARGLRKSPGESAAIVADAMAGMIQDGKVDEAVTLIRKVVDANKDAKDARQPLKRLELRPNTLAVSTADGRAIDPLSNSPVELLQRVEDLYTTLEPQPTDPFYVRQNLEVVRGLLGPDITSLFDAATPSMISAELADTLTDVHDLIERAREGTDDASTSQIPADNLLIEKLYQTMQRVHDLARFQIDWNGEPGPTLEEAVRGLLPKAAPEPQAVLSRPHALAMINDISAALGDDAQSVAILKGAYYETPHLFPAQEHVDSVTHASLKDKKVILLEPHPNNAAETEIHPHHVLDLFSNLFDTDTGPHTVVLDLTLSHLSEPEVATILDAAKPHIQSGKLNLVLVQSGTKFYQSGMDIVNVGTAITFNNGDDTWKGFNDATKNTKNPLPAEDQAYVARMLDRNGQQLMDYLNKIRSNTAELRDLLSDALGPDSAFTLSKSTDPTTVYVAFRPTDAFIAQTLGKSINDLTFEDRMKVNQDLYAKDVLPALEAATLPAVDRTSFGFNVTNFGECATTVRITPGIEERSFFESYSKVVADVGARLAAELRASQPTTSPRDQRSGPGDPPQDPDGQRSEPADPPQDPGDQRSKPGDPPQDPGVGSVYSLGSDATVEQNAANLAGKEGHRRVSLGELGALGSQDKLTMVAHGEADRFGGLTPGDLAAHLKDAGLSALGTLSLKGCDSATFARDLMLELQKQGISVNRITGRNGRVTITEDGRTLVDDGQRWMHQAPGAKAEVRLDGNGEVVASDAYAHHDAAAVEARSQPLRERMNADPLNDETAAPEGGRPAGAGKVARGLKKIVAKIKGDRPSAPPPAENQGERYLDPNKLIAAREEGGAKKQWNPTHREWYLDQATLLDAYQEATDPAVRKQLALLMMHSFYKVATIDQDKANLQERQISPFLPQPYRYHRSTQSSLLDRVHVAYESALGFRPLQAPAQEGAFQVARPPGAKPQGVIHLVDNSTFREVLAREYVTKDLAADSRVNDLDHFRRTVRDLLDSVDHRSQTSRDDKVLFDVSAILEDRLGGGAVSTGVVEDLVSDLETSFLEEVASFLTGKQSSEGFDQGRFIEKLAQVLAGTQVAAFTQHLGHTLLVTPHFLERRPAGAGPLGALPDQQVIDLFSRTGSKHAAFAEELQGSLSKSGYRVDPITAKEAWLDVESVESIFAQEGLPLTTLGTKGSGIPELHASFQSFLGSQTLQSFEALAGRHPQDPYVRVLSEGTAALLRGLGEPGGRDLHAVFQEKGLHDLLQTSYHRIETAMREAMAFPDDFSRFLNQVEVIHQQVQALLEIVSPYDDNDFAGGLLGYLGDTLPEDLTPNAELYPSAMHTVASTLAAVEALKGDNELNIAVLKDSYYESSMVLGHARTYDLWSLDGDALRGGQPLQESSLTRSDPGREAARAPRDLRTKKLDVFLGELRHNISANRDIYAIEDLAHEVDQLFDKGLVSDRFTVMIDNTIDHLRSEGVRRFLEHNAGRIRDGRLNVVVFRSAQKFDMLGMDNYYGGFAFGVNNPDTFTRFNERTRDPADRLKGLNRQGLTHLVKSAGASLDAYRSGIMQNTRAIYDALPAGFKHDPSVTPGPGDARRHMYVAMIEGDDKQVFLDITFKGSLRDAFASQFNKFIRENGLPVDERSSFGFATSNLTTIAELGKIRFNPGLEGAEHRDRYVEFFTRWFRFIDTRLAAGKSVGDILYDLGTIGLAGDGGTPP